MTAYKSYLVVWATLVAFTAVTLAISFVKLGAWNAAAALSIASIKAALVALYFMHLRHEIKLVLGFALFPLVILALIIMGTLTDVIFR
jgi:cytochrome c oxidase subunit IV